jgi:hypothetical protein
LADGYTGRLIIYRVVAQRTQQNGDYLMSLDERNQQLFIPAANQPYLSTTLLFIIFYMGRVWAIAASKWSNTRMEILVIV